MAFSNLPDTISRIEVFAVSDDPDAAPSDSMIITIKELLSRVTLEDQALHIACGTPFVTARRMPFEELLDELAEVRPGHRKVVAPRPPEEPCLIRIHGGTWKPTCELAAHVVQICEACPGIPILVSRGRAHLFVDSTYGKEHIREGLEFLEHPRLKIPAAPLECGPR